MYHIIVNPIAGRGQTLTRLPLLTQLFEERGLPYELMQTTAPMDAYELAKHSCLLGSEGVIGVGGDGTMQEIVSGMADAFTNEASIPVPLGIFPAGSGNDFVMTLEGSKSAALARYKKKNEKTSTELFVNAIQDRRLKTVDLIKANDRAYLNISNIGLDSRIVKNAVSLKKRYGRYAYLASVYKSIVQHKNMLMTIEANGVAIRGFYTLVAVCNGQYYGGGMRVAPKAQIDDGLITVCVVEAMSRPKTMLIFPSLLCAMHVHLSTVFFIRCKQITITPETDETLCLDGNLYDIDSSLNFQILPKALNLFVHSGLQNKEAIPSP